MKKVLITGSSQGLGLELAKTFFENNYNIFIHGRSHEKLIALKSELENKSKNKCTIIKGDLSSGNTIDKLASVFISNDIDVLINNAGVYLNNSFMNTSIKDFEYIFNINFFANVKLLKIIFPFMASKKSGLIININSLAGKNGSKDESAYCASKHAMKGFTESIQFDATKYGIRIVDVFCGGIKTKMTKGRPENNKFIYPEDASKAIFNITNNFDTLRITELNLARRNY